ncbi:MAG TPA: ABC transporter permease [Bryobacteraceae bacterium]|nr:ABC transporter permease [Bryobacteraceae bacterium]
MAADLRYAIRMMRGNPGFTAVAVAALALGIGANTAIFTVVNHVLLEPLPYPQPDRMMRVGRYYGGKDYGFSSSIPKYMVWRDNQAFEAMTLYGQGTTGVNFGAGDRPEQAKEERVSEGFFRVFGVSPAMGRTFTPQEDLPGGAPVAVLSYGFWQSRLGGERSALGRAIPVDGKPTTIVGIMPKDFASDPPADLWVPLQADPHSSNQGHYLAIAGRLKPDVTLPQARAAMKIAGEHFRALYSKWMGKNETVGVLPMREAMVGEVKTPLLILLGAVAFVLLIACANVANLLLARAAARQKELAVRAAMGASRGRMVRQLLTESLLLGLAGGAVGLALGSWGVRALLLLVPGNIPRLTDSDSGQAFLPALDWRVAAFTFALAVVTAVFFGLLPALHTSNPELASTLKEAGGRSGSSRAQNRLRSLLVVAEVAMALVLLVGASLMIRTFAGLRDANPGIDPHNILTLETSLGASYSTTAKVDNFATQVARRLESVPGVDSAAAMVALPVTNEIDLPFSIAGKPDPKGSPYNGDEQWRSISPHYFRVFRIPLLRGRVFTETDTGNSTPVVIINAQMAKRYWPKEDPIGQVMEIGKGIGPQFADRPRQIVGIVGNVRETGLRDDSSGVMYVPESQVQEGLTQLANSVLPLSWAVRTAADPSGLRAAIEAEFRSVDSLITPAHPRTMEQVISQSVARQNFNMVLLSVFAGIALLLAAIGIYGLMAYSVERRSQEIGIRMALGAGQPDVVRMVLGQGAKLAGAGLGLGLALAYGLTRLLSSLLFGVRAGDPASFAITAAVLATVSLAASYIPARRAARVEPSSALRSE